MWLNFKQWIKTYDFKWKYKLFVVLPIFVVLVAIDWISKGVVVATMTQGEDKSIGMDGFLGAHFVMNPGSAMNMNANNPAIAILIAAIITIVLAVAIIFINDWKWLIGVTFIFSGSFANLLARAWAPVVVGGQWDGTAGGVVDFLHWEFGLFGSGNYVFNMADMWVNIGIALMVIAAVWEAVSWATKYYKGKQAPKGEVDKNKVEQEK